MWYKLYIFLMGLALSTLPCYSLIIATLPRCGFGLNCNANPVKDEYKMTNLPSLSASFSFCYLIFLSFAALNVWIICAIWSIQWRTDAEIWLNDQKKLFYYILLDHRLLLETIVANSEWSWWVEHLDVGFSGVGSFQVTRRFSFIKLYFRDKLHA